MIEIISGFAAIIVIFIVLFWLKKTLFIFGFFFKLFMFLMLAGIVASVLFGYLIVKDANDFKDHFVNNTNLFVVKNTASGTTTFLSGVAVNIKDKTFIPLSNDNVSKISKLYDTDKMSELEPTYYKVFVIDIKAFDSVESFNISDQNIELDGGEIKQIMLSDDARDTVATIVSIKNNVSKSSVLNELNFKSEEIKAYILSYYLTESLNPESLGGFITQLKSGNIKIYKETMLFKTIRYIPSSLVNFAVNF